jgi:hypothetical protein
VKQELRYWPPVRRHVAHRLTDAVICGLPLFRLLIKELQPSALSSGSGRTDFVAEDLEKVLAGVSIDTSAFVEKVSGSRLGCP